MTPGEVNKIEKELNIELPGHYKALVTDYPTELIDTEAPDFALLDSPQEIINENREVKENGYFGEEWPERYFIIGHNGCGDYYVISLGTATFSVGFSDHEKMECNLFASSREEFVKKVLDEIG